MQAIRFPTNSTALFRTSAPLTLSSKTNTGVIFTGGSKIAEHGGLNEDDVHTALLLSLPGMKQQVVKTQVLNQQVAPTILKALGIDPNQLDSVRKEQISVLPFFFEGEGDK